MSPTEATPSSTVNGRVLSLKAHGFTAVLATRGATVVALEFAGRPLVRGFDPSGERPVYSGALLAPWPNRVIDASYEWQGRSQQLNVTEAQRGHALHGLVAETDFELVEHTDSWVSLRTALSGEPGYPFSLQLQIDFRLETGGLRTSATVHNTGRTAAPFGWGSHSYLVAPGDRVDDWQFSLPAQQVQEVSGPRLIPGRVLPVEQVDGGALDFRGPRNIGETFIDHAYTQLSAGTAGTYRATVTDAHGVGSQISWDASCPWVQIHTGDRPEAHLHRTGLAIEPMTCPPGAFNSGTDVIRLAPRASHEASWLIGPVQPR